MVNTKSMGDVLQYFRRYSRKLNAKACCLCPRVQRRRVAHSLPGRFVCQTPTRRRCRRHWPRWIPPSRCVLFVGCVDANAELTRVCCLDRSMQWSTRSRAPVVRVGLLGAPRLCEAEAAVLVGSQRSFCCCDCCCCCWPPRWPQWRGALWMQHCRRWACRRGRSRRPLPRCCWWQAPTQRLAAGCDEPGRLGYERVEFKASPPIPP